MQSRRVAALVVCLVLVAATPTSAAVSRILTVTHVAEVENWFCVPAAVTMEIRSKGISVTETQYELYDQAVPYKRCSQTSSGLDPRAWAFSLYMNTPSGYYYDHYTYTSAYSGTRAMLEQQYFYNEVAGALVNEGHHAFVFQGANTSCNPTEGACQDSVYTINTVYVNDPWYLHGSTQTVGGTTCTGTDRGSGSTYSCGKIGLAPDSAGNSTAIAYSTWKTYYYTPWNHQPSACDVGGWNGKWVAVRRKSSGQPHSPVGGSVEGSLKDPAMAPSSQPIAGRSWPDPTEPSARVVARTASADDLDSAIDVAKLAHGLSSRQDFNAALEEAHVRAVYPVHSLTNAFPDYYLADVVGPRGTTGLAMFVVDGQAIVFGGLALTDPGSPTLLSANQAIKAAGAQPNQSRAELVWGWSDESNSPFMPLYHVVSTDGEHYVDMSGHLSESVHLQ